MIYSFSVIVPVLNKENEIIPTLQSIEDSIAYFYAHHNDEPAVEAEVVVVNEGSSDRTLELVTEFAQSKPHYKIINHFKSLGIGPARNTGAKVAKGDLLFFFDGDDLVFPHHLYLCFRVLNHHFNGAKTQSFELENEQGNQTIYLPNTPVAMIRTGVLMRDQLHPHWKKAIENTIMQNFAIRRECHEFIEGFSESPIYKQLRCCEDIAYNHWAIRFFKLYQIDLETVEYIRYPGNALDRQLKKFQTPPEQYKDETPLECKELHAIRLKSERDKLAYLLDKFKKVEKTPEFLALLNSQAIAAEYLLRKDYQTAIAIAEQGLLTDPSSSNELVNILAVAYNNLGSEWQQQKNFDAAANCFKQAIELKPNIAAKDVARICFNAAVTLREQGVFAEALTYLQQAIMLDAQFKEAIAELPKARYRAMLSAKSYEFSDLPHDIEQWLNASLFLENYINQQNQLRLARVLHIGCRDGQIACWLIDTYLSEAAAKITCIDICKDEPHQQSLFESNIAKTGRAEAVKILAGDAKEVLRSLVPNSYDLLVIGDQTAADLLEILMLSWGLLKVGGIILLKQISAKSTSAVSSDALKVTVGTFNQVFSEKIQPLYNNGFSILQKNHA